MTVVLGDSEVTFLREGENAAFSPSLYWKGVRVVNLRGNRREIQKHKKIRE